jgi:asparagine synthase (glutamine-hydrolysing)
MCGIIGIFSKKKICNIEKESIKKSIISLKHRGPNQNGFYCKSNICFGHTRLSIIDLKNALQPMTMHNRYTIVFNGEIVNFKKLRDELITNYNHNFFSNSDTEVILAYYHYYGTNCVQKFEGMFAFIIYDDLKNEIIIARDKFGIKPLYYFYNKNKIIFSSELRQFNFFTNVKNKINNLDIINEFIVHGYIYGKETIFQNIYKVIPGQIIKIRLLKEKFIFKYDKIKEINQNYKFKNEDEALDLLDDLLKESVKLWSTADVDLGLFLSGGVDSSLIAYYLSNINKKVSSYSYYYPEENRLLNEISLVKKIKNKINIKNYPIKISNNNLGDKFTSLIKHLNEPLNDLNSLTFMSLCKGFREITNTKVVLTGDGADEIFGGYDRHLTFSKKRDLTNKLLSNNYLSVNRLKNFCNSNYNIKYQRYNILKNLKFKNRLNQILYIDRKVFLPQYLNRIDKIGMMHGIEFRPPFLSHEIVRFSKSLNENLIFQKKKNNIIGKYLLRKLNYKKFKLKNIAWPAKKIPFGAPSKNILNKDLKNLFNDYINNNSQLTKFFDIKGIQNMYNEQQHKNIDHSNTLTRLLSIEVLMKL